MAVKKKSSKRLKSVVIGTESGSKPQRDSMPADPPSPDPLPLEAASAHPAVPSLVLPELMASAELDALARSSVALANGVQDFGRALVDMQRHALAAGLSAV